MAGMYIDRLARVVPPRDASSPGGAAAGVCRAVACNVSTTSVELDSDLFQLVSGIAGAPNSPGGYGRALLNCHAEGNDVYILFGGATTVVANSAAVAGNTMCARIPAGQEREFEIDPAIDKFFSARTLNGGALTATLRYRITSFPTQGLPGSG